VTKEETIRLMSTTPPWDRLHTHEAVVLADALHELRFAPHSLVQTANEPLSRMLWRIEGAWQRGATELPPIIGVSALLERTSFDRDVVAGPEGVVCLALGKGHFFTVNSECPNMLLGWLTMADVPTAERGFC